MMQNAARLMMRQPITEAAGYCLQTQWDEWIKQEKIFLAGGQEDSIEAVHAMRVALRRSLALLIYLRNWLDPDWLAEEIRFNGKLLKKLGKVRDADVMAQNAAAFFQENPQIAAHDFLNKLRAGQDQKRQALRHDLLSKDTVKALNRHTTALKTSDLVIRMLPAALTDSGEVRLYHLDDCLPAMLYQAAAAVTVYHSVISGQPAAPGQEEIPEPVLHQLRIAAKNFRYLLAFFQPLWGEAGETMLKEFRVFQDVLGGWHDGIITLTLLERLGEQDEWKEAVQAWQHHQHNQLDSLRDSFLTIWKTMTPAWFHQRLSRCLSIMAGLSDNGGTFQAAGVMPGTTGATNKRVPS
ncbi:MAG: CHAD domain-containing protein [Clostridiaceae bacterium]|nr:CHAD domain-containing protein [Clostridiaceae bacterium]